MTSSSQRRLMWVWSAVALSLSVGLCFVPLFDLIGYELALAIAPLAALASTHLGLRTVAYTRIAASRSDREATEVRPLRAVVGLWLRTIARTLPVLAIPLVVLALNGLRVKNCNPNIGLVWYAVLPLASAMFGAALGVAMGLTQRRSGLEVAFVPLFVAGAWSLARLYWAPPIFVFDPLFGYFAGSVYDERVTVPVALLFARCFHLAVALALVTAVALFLDGATLTLRWRSRRNPVLALLCLAVAVQLYRLGPKLGYREDARTIAAALGGTRTTPHFVLHYAEGGPYAKELDDVARELEFRWSELARSLGRAPTVPVNAYLFSSANDKQALMGAGHTYIAKPWRREIYVNFEAFPQPVLGHELAHVFGADLGDALLGLPRRGLRLDVGLTEGFAEALTWQGGALTPDESSAVLEKLHRLPSLDAVMSPGFWSLPAQQAYAVAGSFCHLLIERYGMDRFERLYQAGGARDAYETIYGKSFTTLASDWLVYIRGISLAPDVLERERDRILRPSIFRRPCARELARKLELARQAGSRGDHRGAEVLLEAVCADEPDDPGHLEELLGDRQHAGDLAGARKVAARLLAHPKLSASQRAATYAVLADLSASEKHWSDAAADYRKAESKPSDEAQGRLYTAKRVMAERLAGDRDPAALRPILEAVLATLVKPSGDGALDFARLTAGAHAAPDDPLLAYLAARQLANKSSWADAEALLAHAVAGGLSDERFEREAQRLDAELAFRRRDLPLAASRYDALAKIGPAAARLDAERWARRARWFEASSRGTAHP
ncbi:MAG: hypothetical protein ABI321_23865 [Polyangia bacterium]